MNLQAGNRGAFEYICTLPQNIGQSLLTWGHSKPEARLLVLAWLLLDKPGQAVQALDQGTPLLIIHVLFIFQQCVHEAPEGTPQQPMHPPHLQVRPLSGDTLRHASPRGGGAASGGELGKGVREREGL